MDFLFLIFLTQRDGKRQCPCCKDRIGIRSQQYHKCKAELKKKEKDWEEIAAGPSADGNECVLISFSEKYPHYDSTSSTIFSCFLHDLFSSSTLNNTKVSFGINEKHSVSS